MAFSFPWPGFLKGESMCSIYALTIVCFAFLSGIHHYDLGFLVALVTFYKLRGENKDIGSLKWFALFSLCSILFDIIYLGVNSKAILDVECDSPSLEAAALYEFTGESQSKERCNTYKAGYVMVLLSLIVRIIAVPSAWATYVENA